MTPLVHIGYHKTGSTWLQRQIFRDDMGFDVVLSQAQVDALIVAPHRLNFDPNMAQSAASAARDGRVPVVSSENLSGHPFFGGRDSFCFAERVQQIWPNARILIVTRAQTTVLPSVYMQYLKRGGVLPPKAFFAGSGGVNYPGFDPMHFAYDRLIAQYQSLFSNVTVLTYESLERDPAAFAADLLTTAGAPENALPSDRIGKTSPSPSTGSIGLLRAVNRVRRSVLNPCPLLPISTAGGRLDKVVYAIAARLPESTVLTSYVREELALLYRESNARLAQLRPELDLSAYP